MKKDSLFRFLKYYLKKENVRIDYGELYFQLLSHPYYPSLNSIVGVLNHFNITNYPIKIDETLENLNDLPQKFITKTNENKAFVKVQKVGETILLVYEDLTSKKYSKDDFMKIWEGKVLVVESPKNTPQHLNQSNLINIGLLLGVSILIILIFFGLNDFFEKAHFLLTLIGLFFSILIINKELGGLSPILDKVCNFASNTDCDKVIFSKELSLPFGIKFGDLALTYFASIVIFWSLSTIVFLDILVLTYLAIMTVPIILFSIYYQKVVVKKWCPLCLAIVAILLLQIGVCSSSGYLWKLYNYPEIFSILLFSFILIQLSMLWVYMKKHISRYFELEVDKIKHYKFKSNFELFRLAYTNGKPFPNNSDLKSHNEIMIGNYKAETQILMVTNPTCSFCKSAYQVLKNILYSYPDNIAVTLRFSVDIKNKDSVGFRIAQRLIANYKESSKNQVLSDLDILSKSNQELIRWLDELPPIKKSYLERTTDLLEKEKDWCIKNQVFFTPFVMINNIPFPKQYDISDLPLVIRDLIDYQEGDYQLAV